jgi:two-component system LytT family sensor kinase
MTSHDATTLVHLLGFMAGVVLYALLGVMTLRATTPGSSPLASARRDRIPLATAFLGLLWNAGALAVYSLRDFGVATAPAWITTIAFGALGFLPAVVVHSSLRAGDGRTRAEALIGSAYLLSAFAAAIQLYTAWRGEPLPSRAALLSLTLGYGGIIALLVLHARRQPVSRRALSVVALAAFAVMALHLSQHAASSDSWPTEIVGHHASIPLALVILYQDYRFALADLVLKRVLTFLALVTLAVALYAWVAVPWVFPAMHGDFTAPAAVAALIGLWLLTAVTYPVLRHGVARFVDRVVLRRADYRQLRHDLGARIAPLESADRILDAACTMLAPALSAEHAVWRYDEPSELRQPAAVVAVRDNGLSAIVHVPASERPLPVIDIGRLTGGRRLLSDDLTLLDGVAQLVARRIDAVRTLRERFDRDLRERDMLQLATEAELRALRAQLNPHFLFNTLTTIGHLMQEAPGRALDTLYQLTGLLRAVLRRSDGAFTTLGEELDIVRSYLAIECARFEQRLSVTIDVPSELLPLRVPPLILQPLVENAIKHGITRQRDGGRVTVAGRLDYARDSRGSLVLSVIDTGAGTTPRELRRRRQSGIGLTNLEQRLEHYFGTRASLGVRTALGLGTTVEVLVPLTNEGVTLPGASRAAGGVT